MNPTPANSKYGEVNGRTIQWERAAATRVAIARLLDTGLVVCAFFAIFLIRRRIPTLNWTQIAALLVVGLAFWEAQRFLFGISLGEWVWGLRSETRFTLSPSLLQRSETGDSSRSIGTAFGSFLTALSFAIALILAYGCVIRSPLGMAAGSTEWEAYFPENPDQWSVMPFFYSLGAWPKIFPLDAGANHEVLYSLPYEKGPPERFAGVITAQWSFPNIRVLIEGPKSPLAQDKAPYDRTEIQSCLTRLWTGGATSLERLPRCLEVRQAALGRHLDALRLLRPSHWELNWVRVENKALDIDQQLQGIYLSASNDKRGQDRFVMVTAHGTHQAFVLDYPKGPIGEMAREVFRKMLRSLRVSDDLNPGRAWVDESLQKVNLREFSHPASPASNETSVRSLAEIQALLISRISVDPKTYDTFFHLAGTSIMLARAADQMRKLPAPQGNPELSSKLLLISKPIIQSAVQYAKDVAPQEKRNTLLESIRGESLKY